MAWRHGGIAEKANAAPYTIKHGAVARAMSAARDEHGVAKACSGHQHMKTWLASKLWHRRARIAKLNVAPINAIESGISMYGSGETASNSVNKAARHRRGGIKHRKNIGVIVNRVAAWRQQRANSSENRAAGIKENERRKRRASIISRYRNSEKHQRRDG